jgi:hypothetical protein
MAQMVSTSGSLYGSIPGDPAAIHAAADAMAKASHSHGQSAVDNLDRAHRMALAAWQGSAADAFDGYIRTKVRAPLVNFTDLGGMGAPHLHTYASALEHAQKSYASSMSDSQAAFAAGTAAEHDSPEHQKAQADLTAAEEDMSAARSAALAANQRCTTRLAELQTRIPTPPAPPGHAARAGRPAAAAPDDGDGGGNPLVTFFTDYVPSAANWVYQHGPHQVLNTLGYAAEHPGETLHTTADLAMTAAGAFMVIGGGGGEAGGVAADATGVLAEVGIPLNIASAGLITAGIGTTTYYGSQAAQDLGKMYSEANSDGEAAGSGQVYTRDGELPPARDLIRNGREYKGSGTGRSKNKLPMRSDPNSTLYTRNPKTGDVTNYSVYDENGNIIKRVDLEGRSHGGVDTPHVEDYKVHTDPQTGKQSIEPLERIPRKPHAGEIP